MPRNDELEYKKKVEDINSYLANICENIGFHFIKHDNIKPELHLNSSKLHLNRKGNSVFISNFRKYLQSLN